MEVLNNDALFKRLAGAFLGRFAMEIAAFGAAAEHQHAASVGKMTVHAVVFHFSYDFRNGDLILHLIVGLAFYHHVAAEFTGQDDERAIKQSALLKIQDKLRNWSVDRFLQIDLAGVAGLVSVPGLERDVF